MTTEHDTSGLTCPNCGTSSEDHAVVMTTDDMGACNACGSVWNESDKAVKRIRALEADLKAAREEQQRILVQVAMIAELVYVDITTGQMLARIKEQFDTLRADNARLAALKSDQIDDDPLVCECGSTYPSRVVKSLRTDNARLIRVLENVPEQLGCANDPEKIYGEIVTLQHDNARLAAEVERLRDELHTRRGWARSWKRLCGLLDQRVRVAQRKISNQQKSGAKLNTKQRVLKGDLKRANDEIERLRGKIGRDAELMSNIGSYIDPKLKEQEDELESLRSRLAAAEADHESKRGVLTDTIVRIAAERDAFRAARDAAEARVKAAGAYVQEVADHAPHEQRLQLLALVDRIKCIDPDTQEEGHE